MKTTLNILLLLVLTNTSYSMDHNKGTEEKSFEENIAQLSSPIANFVNDFKTWPKEDQDKIKIYSNSSSQGFIFNGKPTKSDQYDGNIGFYLDCRLTQQQIAPFLAAIDYLKKQK